MVLAKRRNSHYDGNSRNQGLPTAKDIGVVGGENWPIQNPHVRAILLQELRKMAKEGSKSARDFEFAIKLLTEVDAIPGVPPVNINDATTRLNDEQFEKMFSSGMYEELPEGEEVLGVVKVFLHPEPHKQPPRYRVIHWTFTVNQAPNNTDVKLCTVHDARQSVYRGSYAYSIDVKSCFNQFPLEGKVRNLYCIYFKGKWYRLCRLPMGQRQACFIAHSALQVLLGDNKAFCCHTSTTLLAWMILWICFVQI